MDDVPGGSGSGRSRPGGSLGGAWPPPLEEILLRGLAASVVGLPARSVTVAALDLVRMKLGRKELRGEAGVEGLPREGEWAAWEAGMLIVVGREAEEGLDMVGRNQLYREPVGSDLVWLLLLLLLLPRNRPRFGRLDVSGAGGTTLGRDGRGDTDLDGDRDSETGVGGDGGMRRECFEWLLERNQRRSCDPLRDE